MPRKSITRSFETGPHLAAALFCETVIRAVDQTVTIVRVIDQLTIKMEDPTDEQPVAWPVKLTAFISFRTGSSPGKHVISVSGRRPNGETMRAHAQDVECPSQPNSGVNIIFRMEFFASEAGTFLFDVAIDQRVVTTMPFLVIVAKDEMAASQEYGKRIHLIESEIEMRLEELGRSVDEPNWGARKDRLKQLTLPELSSLANIIKRAKTGKAGIDAVAKAITDSEAKRQSKHS